MKRAFCQSIPGRPAWAIRITIDEMKVIKNAISGMPIHPGETLREELVESGIAQSAFARKIGRPVQMVNEIIKGKKTITAETAIAFEKSLGIRAELWLKLEASYQISKARAAFRRVAR